MKRFITPALLLLCALPAFAADRTENDLRTALTAYRQALVMKNFPVLEKTWTDDYTFVDAHGRIRTKAERLADLRSSATTLDKITHEEPPRIRIHDNIGIITSDVTLTGQYGGKKVSGVFRSTHIWIFSDARWQLLMNQLTAVE